MIRFIGILNAGVWLGGVVFLMAGVEPGIFSHDTQRYLDKSYGYLSGALVEVIRARFLWLSMVCGVVAALHLMAEWLCLGRPVRRFSLWLLAALAALALLEYGPLQSHLTALHETRFRSAAPAARQAAQTSFRRWQTVSTAGGLALMGGLCLYLWRVASQTDPSRFVGTAKYPSLKL